MQKEIKSKILKTEPVKWKSLEIIQPKNFKEMSKESYSRLRESLIKNDFCQPMNVWQHNGKIHCLDGHHRIKVMTELEKEGYKIPEKLPANFIKVRNRKEAAKLILIYSSIYANILGDSLYEFMSTEGLSLDDIKMDVELPEIDFEKFEMEFFDKSNGGGANQENEVEPTSEKEFDLLAFDYYYFEFSGGKDSTLAMLKMIPILKGAKKEYEAVFVNTGAELPDLQFHVMQFCLKREIPISILSPKESIVHHYLRKKKLPDPIFRECMHEFIYKPIDNHVGQYIKDGKRVLGIRGGRGDQKTTKSKAGKLQEIERNGLKYLLYSPLYDLPQDQYDEELTKIEKWAGYEKGFIRTACWFCPFTHPDQWDALKENYPLVFGSLVEMNQICKMPNHKGDGNYKRHQAYFKKYW
jgi:3'-phosphoadenosine 5'-phosphosulfate sulfotransferase (PAPS reductase)/FAD synthetase